jgi:hypothetical protein
MDQNTLKLTRHKYVHHLGESLHFLVEIICPLVVCCLLVIDPSFFVHDPRSRFLLLDQRQSSFKIEQTEKMLVWFILIPLLVSTATATAITPQQSEHHACLLGLSGTTSNTILISRGIIQSIQKINPKMSFTILTRDLLKANHSYQNMNHVTFFHGSMLNITDIQAACAHSDLAIFTSPTHPHLSHLDISTTILDGLELAHVKYFIYLSGSLSSPNSFHPNTLLSSFLHDQVMNYRFKDYALLSTGGWMELYWPRETISLLKYLPIFFGLSFPFPHHYTSMRDIGPVTALILFKIIYPGQYQVSTFVREFDLYDPQPYSSTSLTHLLSSSITRQSTLFNAGVWIPSLIATLSPVWRFIHHERLTYLSSLFQHYLSPSSSTSATGGGTTLVSGKGLVNTMSLLGFAPTTVEEYFQGVFSGEEKMTKVTKISGAQARANEIRREEMNEGMAVKKRRREKAGLGASQKEEL